ncbi:MAG: hypothetical protein ACOYEG_12145 [Petrimonas sp.]|jgi:hypothetical protein
MKTLIFAVILMTITCSAFAQETILWKNAKEVLESVEFSADDKRVTIQASAEIFLKKCLKQNRPTNSGKYHAGKNKKDLSVHTSSSYTKPLKPRGN